MAHRFRCIAPGDDVHTVFRTINREFLFTTHDDQRLFTKALRRQLDRYQSPIYAWTGMSNHQHVFNRVPQQWHEDTPFARSQRLNGKPFPPDAMVRDTQSHFVTMFNLTHGREGGLIRDRTKMIKIFGDRHALAVVIYIFQNPVRAGIVRHARDYLYTNFRQYAYGEDNFSGLFTLHPAYVRLGATPAIRQRNFSVLFDAAARGWAARSWPGASATIGFGRSTSEKDFGEFFSTVEDWFETQKVLISAQL